MKWANWDKSRKWSCRKQIHHKYTRLFSPVFISCPSFLTIIQSCLTCSYPLKPTFLILSFHPCTLNMQITSSSTYSTTSNVYLLISLCQRSRMRRCEVSLRQRLSSSCLPTKCLMAIIQGQELSSSYWLIAIAPLFLISTTTIIRLYSTANSVQLIMQISKMGNFSANIYMNASFSNSLMLRLFRNYRKASLGIEKYEINFIALTFWVLSLDIVAYQIYLRLYSKIRDQFSFTIQGFVLSIWLSPSTFTLSTDTCCLSTHRCKYSLRLALTDYGSQDQNVDMVWYVMEPDCSAQITILDPLNSTIVFSLVKQAISPSTQGNPTINSSSILISSMSFTRHLIGKLAIIQTFSLLHNILYLSTLLGLPWLEAGIYIMGQYS